MGAPSVAELSEIVKRAAVAGHGGSFANDFAKAYAERFVTKVIYDTSLDDLRAILAEREELEGRNAWPGMESAS